VQASLNHGQDAGDTHLDGTFRSESSAEQFSSWITRFYQTEVHMIPQHVEADGNNVDGPLSQQNAFGVALAWLGFYLLVVAITAF
jgi:hypothetical protein